MACLLASRSVPVIFVISWVQEKIGGILWILAAIAYIVIAWGDVSWLAYLLMAGPAIVIGILFLWPKDEAMYMEEAPPQAPPVAQEPATPVESSEAPPQDGANISQ